MDSELNPNVPEGTTEGQDEGLTLREELEAQFDAAESQQAEPAAQTGERTRDELGRFTRHDQGPPEGARTRQEAPPQQGQGVDLSQIKKTLPAGSMQAAPRPEPLKPPASWRPEVREEWAKVPPSVQAEVHRREREAQQVLQAGAEHRQMVEAFDKVISPYNMLIASQGATPLGTVQHLLQLAGSMYMGTPVDKVAIVADLIKRHDVSLEMLDTYLATQRMPQGPSGAQFRDPRVDQMLQQQQVYQQQLAYAQQQAYQQQSQQLDDAIAGFAGAPGHEFFGDVRMIMGDLIEMAGKRGEVLSMEDAYKRACQLEPSISKILNDRASAAQAGRLTQAALRAKRAARSVTGDTTPHSGATVPADDSVRGAIEAAWDSVEAR